MEKPKEIVEIEEKLGITLREVVKEIDILKQEYKNTYQRNEKGEVVGLNLADNGFQSIELGFVNKITSLIILDLSDNSLKDISFLSKLVNLRILNISVNDINFILPLKQLKSLQFLNLNRNKLKDISAIEHLKSLQTLYLRNNLLTDIKVLENLENLKILDLGSNLINDISAIKKLEKLEALYLMYNKFNEINIFENLINLKILDISRNQEVNDISDLKHLINLEKLNLTLNFNVKDFSVLKYLENLNFLELNNTLIEDISFLESLTKIKVLYLRENNINDISVLKKFENLELLNLEFNKIQDISILENLKGLKIIALTSNLISDISAFEKIIELEKLELLMISSNPFVEDNGLVLNTNENHLETIKLTLQKLKEAQENDAVDGYLPIKILMLGNHGSGKSSLVHYLKKLNLKYSHDSTHILKIETYQKQENGLPVAYFYDFGGQDFYHGLYQAFLSQKAFTLLLWQTDTNQNAKDSKGKSIRNFNVPYWLAQWEKSVSVSGDLFLIRTYKNFGEKIISYANANVKEEFFLDLAKEVEEKINNPIKESALLHFKNVFDAYIKANQEKQDKKNIKGKISRKYYNFLLKIIEEGNKYNAKSVNLSVIKNWFQDIDSNRFEIEINQLALSGMILKYKETVWLNPQEVVKKVHKILSKKEIGNGVLEESKMNKLIEDENLRNMLIDNKVIFKHYYGKKESNQVTEYIIPNFLPLIEDSGIDYDLVIFGLDNPLFILKYKDFLPFGLINQMICYFGQLPDNKKFWRDQLVFTISQTNIENNNYESETETKNYLFNEEYEGIFYKTDYIVNTKLTDEIAKDFIANKVTKEKPISHFFKKYPKEIESKSEVINKKNNQCKILIKINFEELKIEVYAHFLPEKSDSMFKDEITKYLFYVLQSFYYSESINFKNFDNYRSKIFENHEVDVESFFNYQNRDTNEIYLIEKDITFISLDNKVFINLQELQNTTIPFIKTYNNNLEFYRELPAYAFKNFTNNPNINKMKKIFISYSRKDVGFKDELKKHLSLLKAMEILDNWSCEEISIGKWDDQIQKELNECDLIVYMLSHNFFTSRYVLENEVLKGMKMLEENSNKKILCVIVTDFIGIDKLKDKNKIQSDLTDSILKLGEQQYLPYDRILNSTTRVEEEKIVSLEEFARQGRLNSALRQIVEKIVNDL